jgi:hypothetical protein
MKQTNFYLVAADMGYGHQRAAYPLKDSAVNHEIITINNYKGIPAWEKKYWRRSLESYEKFSRLKKIPLIGSLIFAIMDYFQKIAPFYPKRNLTKPTIQEQYFYKVIEHGLGSGLIKELNQDKNNRPFVTTFFVAAYFAEYHHYNGQIYCIVCDTDVSRSWANLDSSNTKVMYLLPTEKLKERFLMYGVPEKNLKIVGFPLPKENVGAEKEIIVHDLAIRLDFLDPSGTYHQEYNSLINKYLPKTEKTDRLLTLTFAVGGAGAQKEVALTIVDKLQNRLINNKIAINLVAGNRPDVNDYFIKNLKKLKLETNPNLKIIFDEDKLVYFQKFNECLRSTDVLLTKPSELSFYGALGLPILIGDPVGAQEMFNREWLLSVGAGIDSYQPEYIDEWLDDLLTSGRLARAAMAGFLDIESLGTYNIEKLLDSSN